MKEQERELIALTIPGYEDPIDAPDGIPTGSGYSIGNMASWALGAMMALGIILALFFLIYGGVKWIISGGDKEKLAGARKTIIFSVLGLIIMSLALVVVNIIVSALGLEGLQESLFSEN